MSDSEIKALNQHIEKFLRENLGQILEQNPDTKIFTMRYEIEMRERIIRVEEELKNQRELMIAGFKRMDERFEQVEKRFEQTDKRIEQLQEEMNRRFEQVDKRIEQLQEEMNRRFEQTDKRIEQLQEEMNRRFEQVDKRFEQVERRLDNLESKMFHFMIWSFGTTFTAAGIIIAVLKLT